MQILNTIFLSNIVVRINCKRNEVAMMVSHLQLVYVVKGSQKEISHIIHSFKKAMNDPNKFIYLMLGLRGNIIFSLYATIEYPSRVIQIYVILHCAERFLFEFMINQL